MFVAVASCALRVSRASSVVLIVGERATVPDELPGDMDIDLDAMFATGDTVDTPSLRASIEEAVAGIATPRLSSGGATTPAFLMRDFDRVGGTSPPNNSGGGHGGRSGGRHSRHATSTSSAPTRDAMHHAGFSAGPGFDPPTAAVPAPSPSSAALLEALNGASAGMFPFPSSSIGGTPSAGTLTATTHANDTTRGAGMPTGFTPRSFDDAGTDAGHSKAFDVQ